MTTIYIVTAELFDGDCMYFDMVKAFYEKDKAEEFVTRCTEEVNRIRKEVEAHIDKYREELETININVVNKILEYRKKKKMWKPNEDIDSIRRNDIGDIERAIFKSHKYQPNFMDLDDHHGYNIEELEVI